MGGKRKNAKPSPTDFGGPAKALTPYVRFCELHRPEVLKDLREAAEKGGKELRIADSGHRLGIMWESCAEDVKAQLKAEYEAAKREYDMKATEWKQSEEYKNFLEADRVYKMKDASKKAKQVVIEAGHPKKAASSYMLFANKRRGEIISKWRAEGKKIDIKILGQIFSSEWKALSEEQKQQFSDEAAKLKAEYDVKLEEFKTTEAYAEFRKSSEKITAKSVRSKKVIKEVGKDFVKKEVKPRAPKLDAEGNEIPMKARARRAKKEVTNEASAEPVTNSTDVPPVIGSGDAIPAAQ